MPDFETTIVDSFERVERKGWNELVQRSPTNTIFQTYDWNLIVWNTYLAEHTLAIVLVRNDDKLVGIAPMYLTHERSGPIIRFLCGRKGDYSDFIYDSASDAALFEIMAALNECESPNLIKLEKIPADSITIDYLSKLQRFSTNEHCVDCPSFKLNGDPTETERLIYKRKTPAYKKRLLARQGKYEVRHLTDWQSMQEYMPAFYTMHIKQWAVTDTPSAFNRKSEQLLFESILKKLDGTEWALLSVSLLDNSPVSIHVGFIYDERFIWYKPTYDVELYKFSPGLVLMHEMMDYAYTNKMSEFDFAAGNEQFKHIYANHIGSNRTITIYPDNLHKVKQYVGLKLTKNRISKKLCDSYSRLTQYIRENGIFELLRKSTENTANSLIQVIRLDLFVLNESDHSESGNVNKGSGFSISKAIMSDFYDKSPFPAGKERDGLYKSAYWRVRKKKEIPYIAEKDGIIAAYLWVLEDEKVYSPELGRVLEVAKNGKIALIKNGWTHPDYRNQGAYTRLLEHVVNEYEGWQRMIYCDRKNIKSSRAIQKILRFHRSVSGLNILGLSLG